MVLQPKRRRTSKGSLRDASPPGMFFRPSQRLAFRRHARLSTVSFAIFSQAQIRTVTPTNSRYFSFQSPTARSTMPTRGSLANSSVQALPTERACSLKRSGSKSPVPGFERWARTCRSRGVRSDPSCYQMVVRLPEMCSWRSERSSCERAPCPTGIDRLLQASPGCRTSAGASPGPRRAAVEEVFPRRRSP